jgi:hypothetical protein
VIQKNVTIISKDLPTPTLIESTPLVSGTTVDMRVRGGHEEKIMDFVDRVDNFFRSKRFESTMMDCVSIFLLS